MITLSSCKKFLDLKPEYQISEENFFQNSNDFETALTGVYGTFRGLFSSSNMLYIGELTTDNAEIQWSSPSVSEMQLDQNAVNSTNSYISAVWNTCLITISRCNTILNRIDNIDFDATEKNRIKGETLFLRSFSYFYMVRIFGNVPITDEEFSSPDQIQAADLTLQSSDKVYTKLTADLKTAETLLPATLNTDKTRASLGTVKTLLGKVYLTQLDYADAATELKAVIDAHQYGPLTPSYKTMFAAGNNNLPESIFEIEYVSGKSMGNNYSYLFTPAITSMAIFQNNQQGAGRMVPTLNMINSYETGDIRKAASVADSVPLISGAKTYNRYGLKFVDFKAADVTDGSVTFFVLRYADVLLMYAEALNENNQTPDAFQYINLVRERAQLTDLSGLSQDDLRLAIERERRVEFLHEGHRWFDLLRTKRLQTVMNAYYTGLGQTFRIDDFELIFPIPQNEIDLNPAIKQNPNY
jgi:hypothetical protein